MCWERQIQQGSWFFRHLFLLSGSFLVFFLSLPLFFLSDPTPKMEVAPSQRLGSLGGDKLIWQPYPLAFLSDVSPWELPIGAGHKSGSWFYPIGNFIIGNQKKKKGERGGERQGEVLYIYLYLKWRRYNLWGITAELQGAQTNGAF